ncbi:sugar-binding domain-containing protein [Streptomyces sp. NBC_00047]|uniref:sugar-binding domain-containing protein n=1 Tax=Streptomyces sp. NBC_00047 TaxID=2975627 RepID=UPI002B1D4351|nr:sugar-binding domain-containing protein [Streptomyces sp. NBC_00047]
MDSCARVWLNSRELGVTYGSRLPTEFDVTELLRPGRNVLAVRVHQFSAGTYLEDQDTWRLSGIFRDVSLLARPEGGIRDVFVHADYDADTGAGRLRGGRRGRAGADRHPGPRDPRPAGRDRVRLRGGTALKCGGSATLRGVPGHRQRAGPDPDRVPQRGRRRGRGAPGQRPPGGAVLRKPARARPRSRPCALTRSDAP